MREKRERENDAERATLQGLVRRAHPPPRFCTAAKMPSVSSVASAAPRARGDVARASPLRKPAKKPAELMGAELMGTELMGAELMSWGLASDS